MGKASLLAAVERTPWRAVGHRILSRTGFTLTVGRSESIKLAKACAESDPRFQDLTDAVIEALSVSEKSIRLYKIGHADRAKVEAWIRNKRRSNSPLTQSFPGIAPDSAIRGHTSQDLVSLGSEELAVGVAALFTGVREYLQRDEIPLANLKQRGDFEAVYGQKKVFWQTFDCLWLPDIPYQGCQILVSVADSPEKAPQKFPDRSHEAMATELRHATGVKVQPLNLFDAVQNLHDNVTEGQLLLNGFINNAEAVKYHRGQHDLRKDAYDKAGAQAVGPALQPFRVGVRWTLTEKNVVRSNPMLQLLGTSRILAKPQPTIESAIVGNCVDSRDLNFVVERLVSNL